MTIYEKIRFLREKQGLSQQDLADKLGYKSRSAINKIELGLRDISHSKVIAFANALGVSPSYLMGWTDDVHSVESESSQVDNALLDAISGLSDEQVKQTLDYIDYLKSKGN